MCTGRLTGVNTKGEKFLASFGDRRDNIGSFGRPRPAEDADDAQLPVGNTSIVVDILVSPASLRKMTEDVAAAVRQGVELGFASAGTPTIEPEEEPG